MSDPSVMSEILGEKSAHLLSSTLPQKSKLEVEEDPLNQAATIARNMEVWFTNPWSMVEDSVIWTNDQADILNPFKLFPVHPWLKIVTSLWLDSRLVAVPKSRRQLITWLMTFLHLHLAMYNQGVSIFFVSDKEEKSDELVKRAEFIIKNIPDDKFLKPRYQSSYCHLKFPGLNSYIQGVPMGADQLRQFTATAIFADEMAFWDKGRETYMASLPTIQGGGRFTGVSSAQESFFMDLVFDKIQ